MTMPIDLGASRSLCSWSVTIRMYQPSENEGEKEGAWGSNGEAVATLEKKTSIKPTQAVLQRMVSECLV